MGLKKAWKGFGKALLPALPIALQAVTVASPLAGILVQTALQLEQNRRAGQMHSESTLAHIKDAGVELTPEEEAVLLRVLADLAKASPNVG